ncbi:MAG: 2OG-Fe(II) oxygenase [Luteimonas sp.]|nr:2OG-Fe(II) oxygenase [Luteimonas sp.]
MNERSLETPAPAADLGEEQARIALANQLLAGNRYGTPEHERGLELMQRAATGVLAPQAQWLLGAYYLQVGSRPNAQAEAARWLQEAAQAGVSPAIDRLADLYLQGLGLPFSIPRALELHRHLADRGHPPSAWQAGYLASQDATPRASREDPAATAFLRASALAYPPAYYSLGLRFALGAGIAQDKALGRALLLRAADGGYLDARVAADELVPEQDVGSEAAMWHARLKRNLEEAQPLLARLAPGDALIGQPANAVLPKLEAHLVGIEHPALRLDASGRAYVETDGSEPLRAVPRAWDWASLQPKVGISRGFATREECAHLMNKVANSLTLPHEYRISDSANDDAELISFSGRGRPLGAMHSDAVVRLLERRTASMADWSMAALEMCSIIRYQPGEEYRPHVDFFSDEQIEVNRIQKGDPSGQRIATFLLYLHAPAAGGETEYPKSGLVVRGERGMAVLHYNVSADGRQDQASLHIGRPVREGEKWLWRSALRERSLYG